MSQVAEYPVPQPALRHRRGWVLKAIGLAYLRLSGWRFEGQLPEDPKCVMIVAPHTSNWDFSLGLAVVFALEMRASWLGKHTIFKAPFRRLLRWLGGIPVDRRANHGLVGECVRAFEAAPALLLALSPEGTRKGVSQWKTGFYHIATQSGVPIMPVGLDYREHVLHFMPAFHPSGNLEQDLPLLQARFQHCAGLRQRCAPAAN